MNELLDYQKEMLEKLGKLGLSREDIFSVMVVLTSRERAGKFLSELDKSPDLSPDGVIELAGRIAYGDDNG